MNSSQTIDRILDDHLQSIGRLRTTFFAADIARMRSTVDRAITAATLVYVGGLCTKRGMHWQPTLGTDLHAVVERLKLTRAEKVQFEDALENALDEALGAINRLTDATTRPYSSPSPSLSQR